RAALRLRGTVREGTAVFTVQHTVTVVVEVGAAVLVLDPIHVLGLVRALIDVVEDPVAIPVRGGHLHHHRAGTVLDHHLLRGAVARSLQGALGGSGGKLDVLGRAAAVALVELTLAELEVGLGLGEIDRRALHGAVASGALHVGGDDLRVGHELAAGDTAGREQRASEEEQRAHQRTPPRGVTSRPLAASDLARASAAERAAFSAKRTATS